MQILLDSSNFTWELLAEMFLTCGYLSQNHFVHNLMQLKKNYYGTLFFYSGLPLVFLNFFQGFQISYMFLKAHIFESIFSFSVKIHVKNNVK